MFVQSNLFGLAILLVIGNHGAAPREIGHGVGYPDGQFDAIATRLLLCCGALNNPEYDSNGFYKKCQGAVYEAYATLKAREFHRQLDQLKDMWDLPDSCFNVPAVHQVQPQVEVQDGAEEQKPKKSKKGKKSVNDS
ncbi:hypothetical protein DdX_18287 [Ditylenchus destructor]|uniref:Secreted protein n=1 Tax=Ditylenchus destructor TaxID=166010 RepID=A0AAD4MMK2_9BILA|nr:hypothetical protein DdX_18287 [Ditylenchus destructor]